MLVQPPDLPKAERVGSVLYCDKLPYPTHYIQQGLFLVVFVPNDAVAIAKARAAIDILIRQGRLREADVRLRMATADYDFNGMIEGFLHEAVPTKR